MKIDIICTCKKDGSQYMDRVGFKPRDGEIGTIEYWCPNCGNRIYLEIDL